MSTPTMRSNELADLAGVTVRTLRHYHQIGLLEEPERSSNGYRRYTVHHLAKVLRIQRFAELGIPLAEVQSVIEDPAAATAILDGIDRQAETEIDRLTARRELIAELRIGGAAPDLPPALIPYAGFIGAPERGSSRDQRVEREQLALIRHFSEDAAMPWLVAVYETLVLAPDRYVAVIEAFARLPADASDEQTRPLVDEMARLIGSAIDRNDVPELSRKATELILAHQDAYHHDAQRRVIARLVDALATEWGP